MQKLSALYHTRPAMPVQADTDGFWHIIPHISSCRSMPIGLTVLGIKQLLICSGCLRGGVGVLRPGAGIPE